MQDFIKNKEQYEIYWYFVAIVIMVLGYQYQLAKYSSMIQVTLLETLIKIIGIAIILKIYYIFSCCFYEAITKSKVQEKRFYVFYLISSVIILLFFYFPVEIKSRIMEANLTKINNIANYGDMSYSQARERIEEISNLNNIFIEDIDDEGMYD